MASGALSIGWIRPLAEPYLRGYRPRVVRRGSLRGFWFLPRWVPDGHVESPDAGFFVGYLIAPEGFELLRPQPPECCVFASASPDAKSLHRLLVENPSGLVRRTSEYIRWLTHRWPRFEFYPEHACTLVRHQSMRDWPREKYEHFSRNFFIETLAWLVRSALVRKLRDEAVAFAGRPKAAKLSDPRLRSKSRVTRKRRAK